MRLHEGKVVHLGGKGGMCASSRPAPSCQLPPLRRSCLGLSPIDGGQGASAHRGAHARWSLRVCLPGYLRPGDQARPKPFMSVVPIG
jgi:hypothetical protein